MGVPHHQLQIIYVCGIAMMMITQQYYEILIDNGTNTLYMHVENHVADSSHHRHHS